MSVWVSLLKLLKWFSIIFWKFSESPSLDILMVRPRIFGLDTDYLTANWLCNKNKVWSKINWEKNNNFSMFI